MSAASTSGRAPERLIALVACLISVAGAAASITAASLREPSTASCECPNAPAATTVAPSPRPAVAPSRSGPPDLGQSVGYPRDGALYRATRLEPGEGYRLRSPTVAYGTANAVAHIREAIATVRAEYRVHPLVVGDLSSELGGRLLGHASHQSGRDVDLGFYYRTHGPGGPRTFREATGENLHFRATLALIRALAETADEDDGVDWILIDYNVQKLLYRWAQEHGAPEAELARLFQAPNGPTAPRGLLRHYPHHRNPMHVRFKCPGGDQHCESPAAPPSYEPDADEAVSLPTSGE